MTHPIDPTNPLANAIVSQYPANERASRQATQDKVDVDHFGTDVPDSGRHKKVTCKVQGSDPAAVADTYQMYGKDVSAVVEIFGRAEGGTVFPWTNAGAILGIVSGTKMVFVQAAAPAGWTQDTSQNDRVLRVVDDGTGGAVAGSWTLSGVTVDNHVLTQAQMPSHRHHVFSAEDAGAGNTLVNASNATMAEKSAGGDLQYRMQRATVEATIGRTDETGSDNSHNHGLSTDSSWRPAYQNVLVATRD
ncbi:MAG: hypothetical protein ACR2QC_07715 [Gammaproteobacteria bacterium]